MYEHKMFKITREWLHANSTSPTGNSFTREQLRLLGVDWPLQKGWTDQVIGYEIPLDMKLEFESYKGTAKHTAKPKSRQKCPLCGQNLPYGLDHHRPVEEESTFLEASDETLPPWD